MYAAFRHRSDAGAPPSGWPSGERHTEGLHGEASQVLLGKPLLSQPHHVAVNPQLLG